MVKPWLQHRTLFLLTTTLTACTAISLDQVSAPLDSEITVCYSLTSLGMQESPGTSWFVVQKIPDTYLKLKQAVTDLNGDGDTGGTVVV